MLVIFLVARRPFKFEKVPLEVEGFSDKAKLVG